MMSPAIDTALTDRVAALIREIKQVEQARAPVEQEAQAETARLDAIAAKSAAAAPSLWLSPGGFSAHAFNDAVTGALLMIAPDAARKAFLDQVKRRAATWKGLRMPEADKQRRLSKLQADLRVARARLEQRRREIEQLTGEMQPRVGDDPGIWLLPPAALDELAASNGRSR